MSVKMRRLVEREIVRQVIRDLLAAGFNLSIDHDGEDEVRTQILNDAPATLDEMFACDEETLYAFRDDRSGWVKFIYGNGGWDVISDYSTNLEGLFPSAIELADFYEGDGSHVRLHDEIEQRRTEAPSRVAVICEGGLVADCYGVEPVDYRVFDYDELADEGIARDDQTAVMMARIGEFLGDGQAAKSAGAEQPDPDRLVWCCPRCRSSRVQSQMWVRTNTGEVLDDTERYGWCNACEEDGEDGEIHAGRFDEFPYRECREAIEAAGGTVEIATD